MKRIYMVGRLNCYGLVYSVPSSGLDHPCSTSLEEMLRVVACALLVVGDLGVMTYGRRARRNHGRDADAALLENAGDCEGKEDEAAICDSRLRREGHRVFFFFFQAEDGIRDYKVTGVQTCALPISCEGVLGVALDFHHGGDRQAGRVRAVDARGHQAIAVLDLGVGRHEAQLEHARVAARSEERRVGKECRSRWSPYH